MENIIQTVLIYALPVLFAITVHEAAHGYAARHFGDNTAYMLGRITLNPLRTRARSRWCCAKAVAACRPLACNPLKTR